MASKPVVQLIGVDGNAFMVLGTCMKAAKKAGMTQKWQDKFLKEAKSGDYEHLLQTAIKYFDVEGEVEEETCGECGAELNSGDECDDCNDSEGEDEDA